MLKKCAICERVFDSVNGQKYCSDSCKKQGARISNMKYYAKQRILQVTSEAVTPQATKKVFTSQSIITKQFENVNVEIDYITRSINALRELDVARQKVQDIIDVLKIEQNKYNKEDNEFAHTVEGSGLLSDSQKLQIFNDYQKARSKRRNIKDVVKTLICCIRYMPQNSEAILKDAISEKIKVDEFFKDYYKHRF